MHRPRAPRPVVAALLLAAISATLAVAPAPVRGLSAPPCTVDDVLTRYRKVDDWYRSVLDTELRLRASYVPEDLVSVARAGVEGDGKIRRVALKDFTAMAKAAKAAGAAFAVQSAYRSYRTQVATFAGWVAADGYDAALIASARPGHSEHQLGTTVDLKTRGGPPPWNLADWGRTKAGSWLAKHAWVYGWIMSYPEDRSPRRTCYKYEPWHFRYVGRPIAELVHDSGLSLREWLWRKGGTTEWTGPGPDPTPEPTPTPTPTPSASAEPTASPEATATPDASPTDTPTPTPEPPESTPEPTPEPTKSTPEPTPEPPESTPEPTPESTPQPTATPAAG